MHPQAAARMRELVLHALEQLQVQESRLQLSFDTLRPLSDFIAKNCGQWLREDYSTLYAHQAIEHVLNSSGRMPASGSIRDALSPEQKERIAATVRDVWNRIPIIYQFVFPLPLLSRINESFEVAPGILIKDSPREMVDAANMESPGFLGGALAAAAADLPIASLVIDATGLMQFTMATEVPAALAIRTAKIVIELGLVEKIFDRAVWAAMTPKEAKYTPHVGLPSNSGTIELPSDFASVLAGIVLVQGLTASQIARIGAVLRHEADWNPDHPKPRETQELYRRQLQQHCARIATAAEWLFDAEHQPESATTFLQTAIAFEALYGGGKGEPVVETLANRLAYALGKTPQHREHLRKAFTDFYNIRSTVVHSGASRLTGYQRNVLLFMQRSVLYDALKHELDLVGNTKLSEPA